MAFRDQAGRGMAAGLFIRVDQHVIADPPCPGRRFKRAKSSEDDRESAFHVGCPRAVEDTGFEPAERLKRMIDGKHRIHMSSQQYPNRGFRPDSEMEMFATLDGLYRPVGKDRFDRLGLDEANCSRQGSKGVCKFSGHKVEPGKVSGP